MRSLNGWNQSGTTFATVFSFVFRRLFHWKLQPRMLSATPVTSESRSHRSVDRSRKCCRCPALAACLSCGSMANRERGKAFRLARPPVIVPRYGTPRSPSPQMQPPRAMARFLPSQVVRDCPLPVFHVYINKANHRLGWFCWKIREPSLPMHSPQSKCRSLASARVNRDTQRPELPVCC